MTAQEIRKMTDEEIIEFAKKFGYAVLTIEDLVAYRQKHHC